jgi:hypothetical protein
MDVTCVLLAIFGFVIGLASGLAGPGLLGCFPSRKGENS